MKSYITSVYSQKEICYIFAYSLFHIVASQREAFQNLSQPQFPLGQMFQVPQTWVIKPNTEGAASYSVRTIQVFTHHPCVSTPQLPLVYP